MDSSSKFISLFLGTFFLFAGNGLFLNSAGVKLAELDVSSLIIGGLNAAFFAGAIISTLVSHLVISRAGHIRSFVFFGALFAITALVYTMVERLVFYGGLRFLLGFCYYSLLIIAESWMAERSAVEKRAKVLAIYNITSYVASILGVVLLNLHLENKDITTLSAILVMCGMLPIAITRMIAPSPPEPQRISLPKMIGIVPLALIGSFFAGLMVTGMFTMASVFLIRQDFSVSQVSFYLSCALVGGFLLQIPVARWSTQYGRRKTIFMSSFLSLVSSAIALYGTVYYPNAIYWQYICGFFIGCGIYTLYALCLARANDVLPNNMNTVDVSRSILFSYGIGSLIAPILVGWAITFSHTYGFYSIFIICSLFLVYCSATEKVRVPEEQRSDFVEIHGANSPALMEMDPRNDEEKDIPFDEDIILEHIEHVQEDFEEQQAYDQENKH